MEKLEENGLIALVAEVLELDTDEVEFDASLIEDLGADSLDIVDISFSLGKKFGIKLPSKTVLMLAEETLQDAVALTEKGRLTEMGALFLQQGPNEYSDSVAKAGASITQVLASTTTRNWYNLCQYIANHPSRNGDLAVASYIEAFAEKHELAAIA